LIRRKPGFSGKMFWSLEIPFKTGFTVHKIRSSPGFHLCLYMFFFYYLRWYCNIPQTNGLTRTIIAEYVAVMKINSRSSGFLLCEGRQVCSGLSEERTDAKFRATQFG